MPAIQIPDTRLAALSALMPFLLVAGCTASTSSTDDTDTEVEWETDTDVETDTDEPDTDEPDTDTDEPDTDTDEPDTDPPRMPDFEIVTREPGLPEGSLENFLGASNAGVNVMDDVVALGSGWARFQVSWSTVESEDGVYDWTAVDAVMREAKAQGLQVVPMVRNTPTWALPLRPATGYTFTDPQGSGDDVYVITYKSYDSDGHPASYSYTRNGVLQTNPRTGAEEHTGFARLRPADPDDLVDFTQALLDRYAASPDDYPDIRTIQVGNEHIPTSGHYPLDGVEDVASRYFEPVKVALSTSHPDVTVLPCWPRGASAAQLGAFEDALTTTRQTDLSIHYQSAAAINRYLDTYDSVWMTEYGDSSREGVVTSTDPFVFAHSLDTGRPAKLFWWPSGSGENSLIGGSAGVERAVMYSILGPDPSLATTPTVDGASDVVAFETDYGQALAIVPSSPSGTVEVDASAVRGLYGARVVDLHGDTDAAVTVSGRSIEIDVSTVTLAETGTPAFWLQLYAR